MDSNLLTHYRARQRKPVFIGSPYPAPRKPIPFWVWTVAAAAAGACIVAAAAQLLTHLA